jgi:hypothetical protein
MTAAAAPEALVPPAISPAEIEQRRSTPEPAQRVIFKVAGLYGVSKRSVPVPISAVETIDSGSVAVTLDPEADPGGNVGLVDFESGSLRVRYSIHGVFPGLHRLVTSGKHDLSLLRPVRAVATDECTLAPDFRGWRALGCLDFLPGSIWSGASGG